MVETSASPGPVARPGTLSGRRRTGEPLGVLGDVLELAATSGSRWRTVQGTVSDYVHLERQQTAIERAQPPFMPKRSSPPGDPWKAKQASCPPDRTSHSQVWATAIDRYRLETRVAPTDESDESARQTPKLTVRNGGKSWTLTRGGQLTVHDRSMSFGGPTEAGANLLLNPHALLSAHTDVRPGEVGEVNGRATVGAVLVASPTARAPMGPMAFHFGWLGDETTIDLDAATGIIVRLRSTIDGELMRSFELTDLVIDAPLDDSLFTEPPPSDVPARSAVQHPEPVAVVARDVAFTLFAPPDADCSAFKSSPSTDEQMVSVHMMPSMGRMPPTMPMVLTMMHQSPSLSRMPTTDEWEPLELPDGPAWIWQGEPDPGTGLAGEVHIRVDRGGTHIWLRGPHDRAEAIAFVERLQPVVPAP
jgi:outer membrane lipoprotein-sorting protein